MNPIGVVRRIDDLGRVVIPKEIRNLLNLKNGELLNIIVNDDKIVLKKETESFNIYSIIEVLCDVYKDVFDDGIVITNRDCVIKSENITLSSDSLNDIGSFFDDYSMYISNTMEYKTIGDTLVNGYFLLMPVFVDSNFFGYVCIISSSYEKVIIAKNVCKYMLKIIENKCDIT